MFCSLLVVDWTHSSVVFLDKQPNNGISHLIHSHFILTFETKADWIFWWEAVLQPDGMNLCASFQHDSLHAVQILANVLRSKSHFCNTECFSSNSGSSLCSEVHSAVMAAPCCGALRHHRCNRFFLHDYSEAVFCWLEEMLKFWEHVELAQKNFPALLYLKEFFLT